jgi:hypothetical protein
VTQVPFCEIWQNWLPESTRKLAVVGAKVAGATVGAVGDVVGDAVGTIAAKQIVHPVRVTEPSERHRIVEFEVTKTRCGPASSVNRCPSMVI